MSVSITVVVRSRQEGLRWPIVRESSCCEEYRATQATSILAKRRTNGLISLSGATIGEGCCSSIRNQALTEGVRCAIGNDGSADSKESLSGASIGESGSCGIGG